MSKVSQVFDFNAQYFEQITVDNTAGGVALTAAKLKPTDGKLQGKQCIAVRIKLEAAQIRFRIDGGAPTTTVGEPMEDGDITLIPDYPNLANFRAIRTGAVSGVMNVHYFYPV